MNKELVSKKHYCFFLLALSALLFTTAFSLNANAQEQIKSAAAINNRVICRVQFNGTSSETTADRSGYFQQIVNVPPKTSVSIEITYPAGKPGEKTFISIMDGGRLDSGKGYKELSLDNQKKFSFSYQVSSGVGLNRVYVKKGMDENIVQLWVSNEPTAIGAKDKLQAVNENNHSLTPVVQNQSNLSAVNDDVSGNNNLNGIDAPCKGADCARNVGFDPYTGNAHREVKDLEVWGAVGDVPLVWKRFYNSRGWYPWSTIGGKWNYSFNYSMRYIGFFSGNKGYALKVHYPEGGDNTFYAGRPTDKLWIPDEGVGKRVFVNEDIFTLQVENGTRYHFERLKDEREQWYFKLIKIEDTKQNLVTLKYDDKGDLLRITEPAGHFLDLTYEFIGRNKHLKRVTTSDGRSVEYEYKVIDRGHASAELLERVSYRDGTHATYKYEYSADVNQYLLHDANDPRVVGNIPIIHYEYNKDLTFVTYAGYIEQVWNGVTNKMMAGLSVYQSAKPNSDAAPSKRVVYYANCKRDFFNLPADMKGRLQFHIDALGRKTEYKYFNGFVNSITDALGRETIFNVVSDYGNPKEITYADGSKEKWERGDLDLVKQHTDENGNTTIYTRDAKNRITDIDYMDKTSEHFTHNDFGQVLTHTRRNKGEEKSEYDDNRQLKNFTDALKNVTHFTYYNSGLLKSVKDARENTTTFEYNERGLTTKLIHADETFQVYEYDNFGNRTLVKDELGNTWTTHYDEFNRIISTIDPLIRKTEFKYDLPLGTCGCVHSVSKPTKIILHSGKVIENEYNEEWELVRQTVGGSAGEEATTKYEYDLAGNLVTTVDPKGNQWTSRYDKRNRIKGTTDPLGNEVKNDYDFVGNIVTGFRADNSKTIYEYDEMNRIKKTTDPKEQVTEVTEYDAEGNIKTLTDPKRNEYSFEYDLLNRITKKIYPDKSFEKYTYDKVGNLETYTNIAGDVRTYTYDNRNREVSCSWNTNTPRITRTYDAASRLTRLTSSVSSLSYTYNAANELTSETQFIFRAFRSKKINYTYNKDGFRESLTYPNGRRVSYSYTARNQLKSISTPQSKIVEYEYDVTGNRISKELQNGTYTSYSYDAGNRLTFLSNLERKGGGSFAWFDYGYDKLYRRTFVRRNYNEFTSPNNNKGDRYHYDAADQIRQVQYDVTNPAGTPLNAKRTVDYDWDEAGNRKTVTDNGHTTTYSANNLNQYTNIGQYSKNGNLEAYNGWTYNYDAENRMVKAQKGNTTVTFAYDPLGRCVNRTVNGTPTFFYYDGWSLIEEDTYGGVQAEYIHGAGMDEVLTKISKVGNSIFYHHNEVGSVTHLTDEQGKVLEEYTYDIFGTPTITKNGEIIEASAFGNRFMFTGREYIQELGLYDYRNRTYSPDLGRFLQMDPIGFDAGDHNLYRYVGNNPTNLSDPLGLMCLDADGNETTVPENAAYIENDDGVVLDINSNIAIADQCGEDDAYYWMAELEDASNESNRTEVQAAATLTLGWKGAFIEPTLLGEVAMGVTTGVALAYYGNSIKNDVKKQIEKIRQRDQGPYGYQYALRAIRSGPYPIAKTNVFVNINAGDVWKYGETINVSRYSARYLNRMGLMIDYQYFGTQRDIKVMEYLKLTAYEMVHGKLPPGNRIKR